MHLARKSIVWRCLVMAAVFTAISLWSVFFYSSSRDALPVYQNMSPPNLALPEGKVSNILDKGIELMDNPRESMQADRMNFSFLPRFEVSRPDYIYPDVGLIFIGKNIKFAEVGEQIYAEGEKLPGGETILSVDSHGVVVSSPSTGRHFLPWHQTKAVDLQK
ncbi:MAG: hypothetical protein ABR542_10940 [Desulfonatronovibrio sp.]